MCLGLQPVSRQRTAGQLDVRRLDGLEHRGRSVARHRRLEDESIHRPNLLVTGSLAAGHTAGAVGLTVRVR
jgi:hypothetical protein